LNPFAGPSPLSSANPIFGRDRELRELSYLLTSQRIVALHSPSGAGKSSLLNARGALLDRMKRNLEVFPVARVKSEAPAGVANRFVWSVITDFTGGAHGFDTLEQFAEDRISKPSLLVIDQFEEILRVDPIGEKNLAVKREFFRQLGDMLLNGNIWALLVLREDYLAPLDPYRRMVPTHLQNRYRIDLLSRDAAAQAMQGTAQSGGSKFTDDALAALVSNLAKVKITNPDGTTGEGDGDYIEPLQLQVVCRDLWGDGGGDITLGEVRERGDVGKALGNYYSTSVSAAAQGNVRAEYAIRQWIGVNLITSSKTRDQVRRTEPATAGLDNAYLDRLIDAAHLLRAEERLGAPWLELAHDRLVDPVLESNARWFEDNLSEWEKRARAWLDEANEGLRQPYLVTGPERLKAAQWAKENPDSRVDMHGYLAACADRQKEVDRKRREVLRLRIALAFCLLLAIAASAAAVRAYKASVEADKERTIADNQRAIADSQRAIADTKTKEAQDEKNAADDALRQTRLAEADAEARLLMGASTATAGEIAEHGLWAAASLRIKVLPDALSALYDVRNRLPEFLATADTKVPITAPPAVVGDASDAWVFCPAGNNLLRYELKNRTFTGGPAWTSPIGVPIRGVEVQGKTLAVFGQGKIGVIDDGTAAPGKVTVLTTPTIIRSVLERSYTEAETPVHLAISPGGNWIAMVDLDRLLTVWQRNAAGEWSAPQRPFGTTTVARQVAIDDRWIALATADGSGYAFFPPAQVFGSFALSRKTLENHFGGGNNDESITAIAIRGDLVALGGSLGTLAWANLGDVLKGFTPEPPPATRRAETIQRIFLPPGASNAVLELRNPLEISSRLVDLDGTLWASIPGKGAAFAPALPLGSLAVSVTGASTLGAYFVPADTSGDLGKHGVCRLNSAGTSMICRPANPRFGPPFMAGKETWKTPLPDELRNPAVATYLTVNGHFLLVQKPDQVELIDGVAGATNTLRIPLGYGFNQFALDPSGTRLAAVDTSHRLVLVDARAGSVLKTWPKAIDASAHLAIDGGGDRIAVLDNDELSVFDVRSVAAHSRTATAHAGVAFSFEDDLVFTWGAPGVEVFRAPDLEPMASFAPRLPPSHNVNSVSISRKQLTAAIQKPDGGAMVRVYPPLDPAPLIADVCKRLNNMNLSKEQWAERAGSTPYMQVCPGGAQGK